MVREIASQFPFKDLKRMSVASLVGVSVKTTVAISRGPWTPWILKAENWPSYLSMRMTKKVSGKSMWGFKETSNTFEIDWILSSGINKDHPSNNLPESSVPLWSWDPTAYRFLQGQLVLLHHCIWCRLFTSCSPFSKLQDQCGWSLWYSNYIPLSCNSQKGFLTITFEPSQPMKRVILPSDSYKVCKPVQCRRIWFCCGWSESKWQNSSCSRGVQICKKSQSLWPSDPGTSFEKNDREENQA